MVTLKKYKRWKRRKMCGSSGMREREMILRSWRKFPITEAPVRLWFCSDNDSRGAGKNQKIGDFVNHAHKCRFYLWDKEMPLKCLQGRDMLRSTFRKDNSLWMRRMTFVLWYKTRDKGIFRSLVKIIPVSDDDDSSLFEHIKDRDKNRWIPEIFRSRLDHRLIIGDMKRWVDG